MFTVSEELFKAGANLREVTSVLRNGIAAAEFDRRFSTFYVSPLTTAHEFLNELKSAGGVVEVEGKLRLKK